jgi:hypothetical protein
VKIKIVLSIIGLAASLSLASVANATVTTTYFAATTEILTGTSATYSVDGATVTVYDAQLGTWGGGNGNISYPSNSNNTESGLYTLYDSGHGGFGEPSGIAPYASDEGNNLYRQEGIADHFGYDNIIVLQLSGFSGDNALSLLLEASMSGDKVNIYTGTGALPTTLNGLTPVDVGVSIPTGGATTIGALAGLTASGDGWIAIQADCTNLLLNGLQTSWGGHVIPEPRFYGVLLAGLFGLAAIAYKRRSKVRANA